MIKKYQNSAGAMTRVADVFIVLGSWLLAYPIRFDLLQMFPYPELPGRSNYLALLPLILVLWVSGFQFMGVYRYDRVIRRSSEIYAIMRAHLATLILFTSLTYFITQYRFSRGVILVFGVLVMVGCWFFRIISRKILRELNRKNILSTPLLAIGEGDALQFLLSQLTRYPELGIQIVKVVGKGDYDSALAQIEHFEPKVVLIGLPQSESARLNQLMNALKDATIDLHVVPDYSQYIALGATVENFNGIPLIQLNDSPLFGYQAWFKRGMDVLLSGVAILMFSPLLLLIALLIKITSKGPVLYEQERMGLDGRTFKMLKFRSMRVDAEKQTGAVWAVKNDDRRTPIGTFLRSTSLDELPQLWNVFAGDMSLVGPRPERPVFVQQFRHEIPNYMLRHKVKTGITGWAQVNGWRGDTSLEKRIECDIYYIRNWSLMLDLKILFLTVFKGFVNKNAY